LAKLKNEEAAMLFTAGFLVNMGVIPALMNVFSLEKDHIIDKGVIFSDEFNHNCIIIGSKLSGAERVIYKHMDLKDLESKLSSYPKSRRKLIVTDGIFSLDGDIAPLDKLLQLSQEYNSMLMVDDAHATGVLGSHGGGTVDYFNIPRGKVHVVMGTASKGLGISGGFVSGNQELIDYLRISVRSYIFATAPSPIIASAISAAIQVLEDEPELREKLWDNREYLVNNIKRIGFSTMESKTQVIPIFLGDEMRAAKFANILFDQGVFVPAVRWPAVPVGQARIRVTVTAQHTKEHLDKFLNILNDLKVKGC
jgi:8-amino-7-oxononanoate synthase